MVKQMVRLGNTNIEVPKNGFGALPIQRVTEEEAVKILRKAYDNGIRFFDTARLYTDSEKKIGLALKNVRENIVIATKLKAHNVESFWKDLETSLSLLQTDYIDIYQFHTPDFCPKPNDGTGLYEAMLEAKAQGKVRHIGFTNHKHTIAKEAIESGLYETLQFPFSYLASQKDLELVELCKKHNVGFIAMKALSGGLINKADVAYAYLAQFDNVLPIWGIQKEVELDEFLLFNDNPPELNNKRKAIIEKDIEELAGNFCRGCGYCMPCPVGIQINMSARMIQLIRRSPSGPLLGEMWQENMRKIEDCIHCNKCSKNCPYGLDTPNLLKENYEDYLNIINGKVKV